MQMIRRFAGRLTGDHIQLYPKRNLRFTDGLR